MKKLFPILLFFYACNNNPESQKAAPIEKPNIILILADDVGYENMHYTGGQSYQMPNIDSMATQGIQFTRCHATPLCSPSRTEIMTGKYNFRNYSEWGTLKLTERTFGNVLKDAGYTTCIAGKWQLNNGANAMHTFGFDKYCLYYPFDSISPMSCYKNPKLFQDGNWLQPPATNGKYGQDIMMNYIFNFIDSSTKPYFVYLALNLCHEPFTPTPDDSAFKTWVNHAAQSGDTIWYPSMMKYMDKLVGQLIDKVKGTNTIVIFTGDNGTDPSIHSMWNNISIQGGKGMPIIYGTHVPMILWGTGAGIDTSLVDFSDFYPSLARMAGSADTSIDGISFYNRTQSAKKYLYFDFNPNPETAPNRKCVWARNSIYTKYDSSIAYPPRLKNHLYNDVKDPTELKFIAPPKQTVYEKFLDSSFTAIIKSYK